MADTIQCKALRPFTEYVSGYGMVHGNPTDENSDKKARALARNPHVPTNVVKYFVESGLIDMPKDFVDEAEADADTGGGDAPAA